MYQSALSASDEQATNSQGFNGRILTLLTSEELEQGPCLPGLENILCHTPVSYTHLDVYKRQGWGWRRSHHSCRPDPGR